MWPSLCHCSRAISCAFAATTKARVDLVKRLRQVTRQSISACNRALSASQWDFDAALNLIESQPLVPGKRDAKFGQVAICEENSSAAVVVNIACSDDFVARNNIFLHKAGIITKSISSYLHQQGALKSLNCVDGADFDHVPISGVEFKDTVATLLAKANSEFGSSIAIKNIVYIPRDEIQGIHVHQSKSIGNIRIGSRIGVVALSLPQEQGSISTAIRDKLQEFGNGLAMQLVGNALDVKSPYTDFLYQPLLKADVIKGSATNTGHEHPTVAGALKLQGLEIKSEIELRFALLVCGNLRPFAFDKSGVIFN